MFNSWLVCAKVWCLWGNTHFFLQIQKSCPSDCGAACRTRFANKSSLCCGTQSVEYVKRWVWLAPRLSRGFICCQRSIRGLQSMPISFIGFSLLLCYHMHHCRQYDIPLCESLQIWSRAEEISETTGWITMKFCTDVHDSQRTLTGPPDCLLLNQL